MTPLIGFSPDAEPTTPGAIVDASNIVPYEAGLKGAPSAVSVGLPALAADCRGSAVVRQLSGSSRMFAGTSSNMYEASPTAWSSVGSGYSLGSDDRWMFAGFGDSALATNGSTGLIRSNGAGFSAVAGAPKGKCIASAQGFVLVFNTDYSPDAWHCCALYDETSWTPSISTQAARGRLVEGSGGITAAMRFGDQIVAYKSRALFLGYYSGGDVVWTWRNVSFDVGCVGVDAVADTSIGHIFVGSDNIYHFDGTRPVSIATGVVRQWWLDNSSAEYRYKTKLLWDRDNSLVWVFFPSSSSSGACDDCIVFHTTTRQWGRVNMGVETVVNYVTPPITYDSGTPLVTSYDSGPAIAFDSPFWLASKSNPAAFGTDHVLDTLTGIPGAWSIRLGDFGDETQWSYCADLRMRFALKPTVLTCTPITKATSGDAAVYGSAASFDGSKFPLRQTSRFHSFLIQGQGNAKFSAVAPTFREAGTR